LSIKAITLLQMQHARNNFQQDNNSASRPKHYGCHARYSAGGLGVTCIQKKLYYHALA